MGSDSGQPGRGRVAAFTGHMIDSPDRSRKGLPERFPDWLAPIAAKAIESKLRELEVMQGYAPAACGGDLLFIEALQSIGADAHIILPFPRDDFLHTSVAFAGESWVTRYQRALQLAEVTEITHEPFLGEQILYTHGMEVALGTAVKVAEQSFAEPVILALLDQASENLIGGTLNALRVFGDRGIRVEIIDLAELRENSADARLPNPAVSDYRPPASHSPSILKASSQRRIRTMLFADMVGFSKMEEPQSPAFFMHFLQEIAGVVGNCATPPEFCNTWGDGLFVVFKEVDDAAEFALRLRDSIAQRHWENVGLPSDLGVRIGIHTGPVFESHDPVIGRTNYFGTHVNRAARIEPVTDPGQVFCSEAVAAVLAARGGAFTADYVDHRDLAKGYDHVPLYRLRSTEDQ